MTANVIYPRFLESQDLPADAVLEQSKGKLASALVVGWDHEGNAYALSSLADGRDALWLLQTAIHRLLTEQDNPTA